MSVHAVVVYFGHCHICHDQSRNYGSQVRVDTWLKNHYQHKHGIAVPSEQTSYGGSNISQNISSGDH